MARSCSSSNGPTVSGTTVPWLWRAGGDGVCFWQRSWPAVSGSTAAPSETASAAPPHEQWTCDPALSPAKKPTQSDYTCTANITLSSHLRKSIRFLNHTH